MNANPEAILEVKGLTKLHGSGCGSCIESTGPEAGTSGRSNQKVEPLPCSLSTPISPPISSTSWCEIARPRPVPPYSRVVEASACENFENSRSMVSLSMPIPESTISKCSRSPSG